MQVQKLLFPDIIKSINFDQSDIIANILELHAPGGIDLDMTYNLGLMYGDRRDIQPKRKGDINPNLGHDVEKLDSRILKNFKDGSLKCVMYDPPFFASGGEGGIMGDKYSSYTSMDELFSGYSQTLAASWRVLAKHGVLIFKCQDSIYGRVQWMTHCEVMNMAVAQGFYPLDLFIVLAKNRMIQTNFQNQNHARKFHSYFWVFQKKNSLARYPSLSEYIKPLKNKKE
jgi:hypothetical protein